MHRWILLRWPIKIRFSFQKVLFGQCRTCMPVAICNTCLLSKCIRLVQIELVGWFLTQVIDRKKSDLFFEVQFRFIKINLLFSYREGIDPYLQLILCMKMEMMNLELDWHLNTQLVVTLMQNFPCVDLVLLKLGNPAQAVNCNNSFSKQGK